MDDYAAPADDVPFMPIRAREVRLVPLSNAACPDAGAWETPARNGMVCLSGVVELDERLVGIEMWFGVRAGRRLAARLLIAAALGANDPQYRPASAPRTSVRPISVTSAYLYRTSGPATGYPDNCLVVDVLRSVICVTTPFSGAGGTFQLAFVADVEDARELAYWIVDALRLRPGVGARVVH